MAVQFAKKPVSTLDVLQEIGSGAQRCHDPELLEVSRLEKLPAVVLFYLAWLDSLLVVLAFRQDVKSLEFQLAPYSRVQSRLKLP